MTWLPVRHLPVRRAIGAVSSGVRAFARRTIARPTIGISVTSTGARAVGVERGAIRWTLAVERAEGQSTRELVAELLAHRPNEPRVRAPRWWWARASVAIGPPGAQLKQLAGLPPVGDATALAQLVRESASRFFLTNGVPLVVSGVRSAGDGAAWAAAIEEPVVTDILAACEAQRVRVAAVVPAPVAASRAVRDGEVVIDDGPTRMAVTVAGGMPVSIRRAFAANGATAGIGDPAEPVPALAALGDEGRAFAIAYGATRVDRREPLAVVPNGTHAAPARRSAGGLAVGAVVAAMAWAIVSPALAGTIALHDDARTLAATRAPVGAALARERRLVATTELLAEIGTFARGRHSGTLLLADLARALPATSALVALQVDSAGGTLVALAPRAADVVTAVDALPALADVAVVGPVTREVAGSREVERVSLRFRFATAHAPGGAPEHPEHPR